MLGAVKLDKAVTGQRLGQIQRPVLLQPGELGSGLDGMASAGDAEIRVPRAETSTASAGG